jgi:hypothetical protein
MVVNWRKERDGLGLTPSKPELPWSPRLERLAEQRMDRGVLAQPTYRLIRRIVLFPEPAKLSREV